MADTTTSANMGLVIPVPQVRLGPVYATDLVTLINVIDAHDHSSGKGVQVGVNGLSIQADLSLNADGSVAGHNLTGARSLRMVQQAAVLSGTSDAGCVSNIGGDLYWNYSSSSTVRITAGGALNTAGLINNVWARTSVATNISIGASDAYTHYDVSTTGGARQITLPRANAAPGKFYVFTVNSAANAVTFIPNAADGIDGGSVATNLTMPLVAKAEWILLSDGQTAGDWKILRSSQDLNRASVPAGGSLTTGNTLQVLTGGVLQYAALNLAGGSNYVTGRLPSGNMTQATGSAEGIVKLAGDLGGTSLVPEIVQLTGPGGGANPIPVPASGFTFNATVGGAPTYTQASTAGAGTEMVIAAQTSTASTGGQLTLKTGSDSSPTEATAGNLVIKRGAVTHLTMSGSSTAVTHTIGAPSSGNGLSYSLIGSNAVTNGVGGSISEVTGDGAGAHPGGDFYRTLGDGGAAGKGGSIVDTAGSGGAGGAGGDITQTTGDGGSGAVVAGAYKLVIGATSTPVTAGTFIHAANLGAGGGTTQRFVGFFKDVTTTQIPTGDGLLYMADAVTDPSSDPASGVEMFSSSSSLVAGVFSIRTRSTYAIRFMSSAAITQVTVGATGAAAAPPAQPLLWLRVLVNNSSYVIPAYTP
jgi:hypothetical protein